MIREITFVTHQLLVWVFLRSAFMASTNFALFLRVVSAMYTIRCTFSFCRWTFLQQSGIFGSLIHPFVDCRNLENFFNEMDLAIVDFSITFLAHNKSHDQSLIGSRFYSQFGDFSIIPVKMYNDK